MSKFLYLVLGICIGMVLLIFAQESFAREPFASELQFAPKTGTSFGMATSSDPYWIYGVSMSGGQMIFCDGRRIVYFEPQVDLSSNDGYFEFDYPIRCLGTVYSDSSRLATIYYYIMSDADYDEQPTSGGGSGTDYYQDFLFIAIVAIFLSSTGLWLYIFTPFNKRR